MAGFPSFSWPDSALLCTFVHRIFFIHSSIEGDQLQWHGRAEVFLNQCFGFLWVNTQKWVAGSYGGASFSFLRHRHLAPRRGRPQAQPRQRCTRGRSSPHPCRQLSSDFLAMATLTGARRHLVVILICISLVTCNVGYHSNVFLGKTPIQAIYPFFFFLLLGCVSSLNMCWPLTPHLVCGLRLFPRP